MLSSAGWVRRCACLPKTRSIPYNVKWKDQREWLMNRKSIEKLVVRNLAGQRSRSDIIHFVCLKMNLKWQEAEELVEEIEASHTTDITRRRLGMVFILGIAAIIGGAALAISIVVATLDGWVFVFVHLPIPYLGNIFLITLGVLLALGGAIGLVQLRKKR